MPYLNEHSARLRDPGDFDDNSFRRTKGGTIYGYTKVPATIGIIWGKLKGKAAPADPVLPQALRFPTDDWTPAEAKKWLKDNDVKYVSFEAAKEEKDSDRRVPERRFTPTSAIGIETREGKPSILTGYASVFYDGTPGTEYKLWDKAVERIAKTAYDRAVKEDDVRALFNHDPNNLLGRTKSGTMRLVVDERGLLYSIDLPDTTLGKDVAESVRRNDLTGSSFSFIPTSVNWRKEGDIEIREILAVELFDVGPVTYPAYESTTAGIRAVGDVSEARASYDAWKKFEAEAAELKHRQMEMTARVAEMENELDK